MRATGTVRGKYTPRSPTTLCAPAPARAPFMRFQASSFRSARRIASCSIRRAVHWPSLVHALLPNLCAICGDLSQSVLCRGCDDAYSNEARLRCTVCAVPLASARWRARPHYRCSDCGSAPPSFDATLALADYRAPLDTLAVDLKFRARLALAREFARRLARLSDDMLDASEQPDVIAPVPLSARRLVERGYNQAWQIAKPLGKTLRVRTDATLLRRVAHTAAQSRLALAARRANVEHAFAVTAPVRGLHIGIVDDVMTTGATLEAVAHALKAAGARRVTNFVVLRTPDN
jgi:ComF family protein